MNPVRCTVRRYLSACFCGFWLIANTPTGFTTLSSEYPSKNHKRLLLRAKSQCYGMGIGVSEVEPFPESSLNLLHGKDRQDQDYTEDLYPGKVIYVMAIESNCDVIA